MKDAKIHIHTTTKGIDLPINTRILAEATRLLNVVFNLPEFKKQLVLYSFAATNKPALSPDGNEIPGEVVYQDIMKEPNISVCASVRKLGNPWKRWISKTKGQTDPSDTCIITYTWWLKNKKGKDLVIDYTAHLAHEILHTSHFGYVHNPKLGSPQFKKEKDVAYLIDDLLENLIRENYTK